MPWAIVAPHINSLHKKFSWHSPLRESRLGSWFGPIIRNWTECFSSWLLNCAYVDPVVEYLHVHANCHDVWSTQDDRVRGHLLNEELLIYFYIPYLHPHFWEAPYSSSVTAKAVVFMMLCNDLSAPCAIKGGRRDRECIHDLEDEVLSV